MHFILEYGLWGIRDSPVGGRGAQHTIRSNFPENCIMKKIGTGCASGICLRRSATDDGTIFQCIFLETCFILKCRKIIVAFR